jgi:hypothetical protein
VGSGLDLEFKTLACIVRQAQVTNEGRVFFSYNRLILTPRQPTLKNVYATQRD